MTIELNHEEVSELLQALLVVARLHQASGLENKPILALMTKLKETLKNEDS